MRELTADLFVSLDGFAAGVDAGAYFGYFGPELGDWIRTEPDRPQVILMGRVTYEVLSGFASAADEASARTNDLPKVVYSNTLQEPLAWNNTSLLRGDLAEAIGSLKRQPGDPLRSMGSITLVRSMMLRLGLVDRLRLVVFPLILGSAGREPALAGHPKTGLELTESRVLDSRLVVLEYRPTGTSTAGGH
jgi:dihydrofolate reductase